MREVLSQFLSEKALRNENLYIFSGDHGYALFDRLRNVRPEQFINAGIAEQGMVGYAAGMAKEGMKVFVYGLAAFIPVRVFEFIKIDVCYENLPVIFLGDGAGLVYSTLGASHQCAEDIACMRTLPEMYTYSPADVFEMQACLERAYDSNTPSYIRISKADKSNIHKGKIEIPKDGFIPVRKGSNSGICIIATGSMVSTAVDLHREYAFDIFSAPLLAPLDARLIAANLSTYHTIITMEEHSINGGLGSIVAEAIAQAPRTNPQKVISIGINNRFTRKCGSYDYALREHDLDYASIVKRLVSEKVISQ